VFGQYRKKERNNRIFNNKGVNTTHILERNKLPSILRLKANNVIFAIDFDTWWLNLLGCLSFLLPLVVVGVL